MDPLYLQPESILSSTQLLLCALASGYLIIRRGETRATWYLALMVATLGLIWLWVFLRSTLVADFPAWSEGVEGLLIPIIALALTLFAYTFVSNPFEREFQIVRIAVSALIAVTWASEIGLTIVGTSLGAIYDPVRESGSMALVTWAGIVFLRKSRRVTDDRQYAQASGAVPAIQGEVDGQVLRRVLLSLAAVCFLMAPISAGAVLGLAVRLSPAMEFMRILALLAGLGAIYALYLNNAQQTTSFKARLVGLSLVVVLTALAFISVLLNPASDLRRSSTWLVPDRTVLRFEPSGDEGYSVGEYPFYIDRPFGDRLHPVVENDTLVQLGFWFRFGGLAWSEMSINQSGSVSFGGPLGASPSSKLPIRTIAPYQRPITPVPSLDSGVFFKTDDEKATVTWANVRAPFTDDPTNRNTIQLVLYSDGTMDWIYDRLEATHLNGIRGFHPGIADVPNEHTLFVAVSKRSVGSDLLLKSGQSIEFKADSLGRYQLDTIPFIFREELGDTLLTEYSASRAVELNFDFSFAGSAWNEVFVHSDGVISFGSGINPNEWAQGQQPDSRIPYIAPFPVDLDPSNAGEVYFSVDDTNAVFTWYRVAQARHEEPNIVQLALFRDGRIQFCYKRVAVPLSGADRWGLHTGAAVAQKKNTDFLFELNAFPLSPGVGHVENFRLVYRQFVHARVLPLAWTSLGLTLLIILILPLLIHVRFSKPLAALQEGVSRVESGDLSRPVPSSLRDEIGTLIGQFNEMMRSLKNEESRAQEQSGTLEKTAAERTAALEESLQKLTETQDRLIQVEKMASLGQLTAGIAHEIENPLNFVNNFATLSTQVVIDLRAKLEAGATVVDSELEDMLESLTENAATVARHGARAGALIRNISAGGGEAKLTDLNALLSEYVNLVYYNVRAEQPAFVVKIEEDLDPSVGEVKVIPQDIGTVFANILRNAFDFAIQRTREGGSGFGPAVLVTSRRLEDAVEVVIRDNGSGIPEDIRSRIFEPFFTTKPAGKGTGLGLSISHDIVKNGHRGRIEVESEEGAGTSFIITLPVV